MTKDERIAELERRLLEARSSAVAAAQTAEKACERLILAEALAAAAKPVIALPWDHMQWPQARKTLERAYTDWMKSRPS